MICKPRKSFYILITLFFVSSYSFAQQDSSVASVDSAVTIVAADSTTNDPIDTSVTATIFSNENDSILKWKNSREFAYMVYLDSLLHKKTDLKSDTINIENDTLAKRKATAKTPGNSNANNVLNSFPVKIVFWILAVFFIIFILYRLFFKSGLFTNEKVKKDEETSVEEPEKLNEFSEYNVLINEAENKNDFNLATRYLYLQTLKRLSERELILFSLDKTNNLYIQELSGHSYRQQFESLTHHYEYIWYGKFAIDNNIYRQLKEQFISFNKIV